MFNPKEMINAQMISRIKQILFKLKKYFNKLMTDYFQGLKKFMMYLENLIKTKMVINKIQDMFLKMNYKTIQKKKIF